MKTIRIFERAGAFAENKDVGREMRVQEIIPALENGEEVTLDFEQVDAVTQSFVHSLISDVLRKYGESVLERMAFKSCNDAAKQMIGIVVDYMQDAMEMEKKEK